MIMQKKKKRLWRKEEAGKMKGVLPVHPAILLVGIVVVLFLAGFLTPASLVGQPRYDLKDYIEKGQHVGFQQSIQASVGGRCQQLTPFGTTIIMPNVPAAYSRQDLLDYENSEVVLRVDSVDDPINNHALGVKGTIKGREIQYFLLECNWLRAVDSSFGALTGCSAENKHEPYSMAFPGRGQFFSVDGSCSVNYKLEFLNEDGTSRFAPVIEPSPQPEFAVEPEPDVSLEPPLVINPELPVEPQLPKASFIDRLKSWLAGLPLIGFIFD